MDNKKLLETKKQLDQDLVDVVDAKVLEDLRVK